ncbi:MAG TPA: hypothetical protein VJP83_13500, partial [Terriglobales bacterium]|nr:hypothetical protein [Terriglobales bacterium]
RHTNQGGSALFIVSMTFTRFRNEPNPGPDPLLSEEGRRIFNPNGFNRFRCAAGDSSNPENR